MPVPVLLMMPHWPALEVRLVLLRVMLLSEVEISRVAFWPNEMTELVFRELPVASSRVPPVMLRMLLKRPLLKVVMPPCWLNILR